MERSKAPAESTRTTSRTRKPFVRSGDIGNAVIIVALITVPLIFGALIACSVLLDIHDSPPLSVLLFIAGAPSVGFWVATYLLVRRKYLLPWSEIGLTFRNWQRALLWAAALFPVTLLFWWLEDYGWRWLLYQYPIPIMTPWKSPLEFLSLEVLEVKDYGVTPFVMTIFVILTVFSQVTLFWGLGYNALERESSSVLAGILNMAFTLLIIYLIALPFLLSLPFVSACIITFAYQRTRTLLTPLIMTVGGILFFLYVVQPTWYTITQYTIRGNCVCSVDGTALDNGRAAYGGQEYQNVTVVKWSAGTQGGNGETTTSPSGAYVFENAVPRGYNIVLTVTSTHYHSHGTEQQPRFKKCVYTHTEPLGSGPEDAVDIVERDFSLIPQTAVEVP